MLNPISTWSKHPITAEIHSTVNELALPVFVIVYPQLNSNFNGLPEWSDLRKAERHLKLGGFERIG